MNNYKKILRTNDQINNSEKIEKESLVPSLLLRRAKLEDEKCESQKMLAITNGLENNDQPDGLDDEKFKDGINPDDVRTFGHEVHYYMHKIHNKKKEITHPRLKRLEFCKQMRKLLKKL